MMVVTLMCTGLDQLFCEWQAPLSEIANSIGRIGVPTFIWICRDISRVANNKDHL